MENLTKQIKAFALELGFDACGICKAKPISEIEKFHLHTWLTKEYQADMHYMANHYDKRTDPTQLVEGAESIISVALNYYPEQKQDTTNPQFAYYAYGKDYHDVMKEKLSKLYAYIQGLCPEAEGRYFCDTAPVFERYWAVQAGLGFIGKNSLLILPQRGSYFFLGEVIINQKLDYDTPLNLSCGNCTRCIDACPTSAIVAPKVVNSSLCLSYQTIENKGEIDEKLIPQMQNRIYGCDICQQVCPWNRFAKPHSVVEFTPSEDFLNLSYDGMQDLSVEDYQRIFKGSAVKRAKYSGLMRNLNALKQNKEKDI